MLTTRDAAGVLSGLLGTPNVEAYAARLVRAGVLPRARDTMKAQDLTALLLSVLGARGPGDAVAAHECFSNLQLNLLCASSVGEQPVPVERYFHPGEDQWEGMLCHLEDAIATEITECRTVNLNIERGGTVCQLISFVTDNGLRMMWTASYGRYPEQVPMVRESLSVAGEVIQGLGLALRGRSQAPVLATTVSMAMH